MILDIDKELIDKELIDKEVQVTFERVYFEKESTIIAIIKPITKETSQTCNTCKHTIPGNLTECKNGTVSDCYKNSRFEPKETSTNETLEEVAIRYMESTPDKQISKMYSEEEVQELLFKYESDNIKQMQCAVLASRFWFNNNKK